MIFAFLIMPPMRDVRMTWLPFQPLTYKTKNYELPNQLRRYSADTFVDKYKRNTSQAMVANGAEVSPAEATTREAFMSHIQSRVIDCQFGSALKLQGIRARRRCSRRDG
jgi:hypothetical protein